MKRTNSEECPYCGDLDDAHHTVFECPRWTEQRASMAKLASEDLSENNLIDTMLEAQDTWEGIARGIQEIINTKRKDEKTLSAA